MGRRKTKKAADPGQLLCWWPFAQRGRKNRRGRGRGRARARRRKAGRATIRRPGVCPRPFSRQRRTRVASPYDIHRRRTKKLTPCRLLSSHQIGEADREGCSEGSSRVCAKRMAVAHSDPKFPVRSIIPHPDRQGCPKFGQAPANRHGRPGSWPMRRGPDISQTLYGNTTINRGNDRAARPFA